MKKPKAPGTTAVSQAIRLLGYRDRSEAELREWLLRKGFSEADVEAAVERLKDAGFVDDRRLAEALVRYASGTKHLGARGVRALLIKRGLHGDIVDEMTGSTPDDPSVAAGLVRKRLAAMAGLNRETIRRRLWGLLLRRGFSPETIDDVLKSSGV